MKMKNAMQLKALIKNRAASINIPAQMVMQNYVLERLLERIAASRFRDSFIVKGGFLLASIIGLDTRTTKDLDATVRHFALLKDDLHDAFIEISNIAAYDDLSFEIVSIEEIREGDEYPGLRVSLVARFEQLAVPLSVDVTTGDDIFPPPVSRVFTCMFGNHSFTALSYPLETVAAEKLETVLSRMTANTRARDYYDIYTLDCLDRETLDDRLLHEALIATTAHRNTAHILEGVDRAVAIIRSDTGLARLWDAYVKKNSFARGIAFQDTCDSIIHLMGRARF